VLDTLTVTGFEVDKENGEASITIINNAGSLLPSTGGIGTTIFYVVGGVLVLVAVVLLITRKRMKED
jgi:LPXTG-motif cell wall-anchored protein